MKILIMVHSLTGGGAERVAASWANGLSHLGHKILLYTDPKDKTYQIEDKIEIIKRKTLLSNSKSIVTKIIRRFLNPIYLFIRLLGILITYKPDVTINVLYLDQYPLLLARLISLRISPIIMTDHNAYERPKGSEFKWRQWKHKFLDNKLYDKVTVLTKRDKDILTNKGFKNVEVLHNPLFFEPVKNVPEKENIIMAVGRYDAWHVKGFDLLLKVWDEISSKYPEWKLILMGDGSKKSKKFLQDQVTKNPTKVIFKPFSPNIVEEYKRASIFVLSSRYEGWGLVAVEAMSQGCATIACNYQGRQGEFIENNVNGILCAPDDGYQLRCSIEELITNKKFKVTLQNNAIKNLEKYSEINVAYNIEKIIKSIKNG